MANILQNCSQPGHIIQYVYDILLQQELTLSSAVVQVYTADRNSVWSKKCCGVACLVKDNPQRSYFIRVYDIKDGKILWEQELYNNFSYNHSRSYFHTFAGDCVASAVFRSVCRQPPASLHSADSPCSRLRASASEDNAALGSLQASPQAPGQTTGVAEKRRDPPNGPVLSMATVDIKNPEINTMRFNNSQVNNIMPIHIKDKKKVKGKRKKLTKADIGTPSNFQHIGHVGWDPNTGFDVSDGPESAPSTPGPTAGIVGALMEEEQKELDEITAKRQKKGKSEEEAPADEKTMLHAKDMYDYQGRSYLHVPQDVGVNLRSADIPDKCYLPKKQIHAWSGHTKVTLGMLVLFLFFYFFFTGHSKAVRDICFNNTGTQFLSAAYDRYLKLWDTETDTVFSIAAQYNYDFEEERMICSRIPWDVRSREFVQEYDRHLGAVNTITFVDENRRFVSTSDDKSLRVWEW
ncbi:UNVERIFIED_CONTAM: hypothetical protein FKN15_051872 [Acipenser sinensis]